MEPELRSGNVMRDLSRLLRPKSLAVFGSSWAENVIRQCEDFGFEGEIWPVHPKRGDLAGRRCFRSVSDLPGSPDAAFIGVNRDATLDVISDLRSAGCGGAVSFASGFSETGTDELQSAFVARAGDMPVLGPNCYGLINALDGAVIWPDQQGCRRVERGVAIISQSSSIGITLTMQRRGLPIAYLACVGNAAQTGLPNLAAAMLADERVSALGVFMEGVGDAAAFAHVVQSARASGKGIVVLKAGRSDAGKAAAMTHTASLAGSHIASSAYLARIGAGEVSSLEELCEALKVLHVNGPIASRNFVSVSCSGGEAGLMADAADCSSLAFPPIPSDAATKLSDILGPLVTISNPLDYHTAIWGDEERMRAAFVAALSGFDGGLFVIDPPRSDRCDPGSFEPAFRAMSAASKASGKPAFVLASLSDSFDEARVETLMGQGLIPMLGVPDTFAALEAASAPEMKPWTPWKPATSSGHLLNEAESKRIVALAGIDVPRSITSENIDDLDATGLNPPFALKGLGFAHKSEAGAVRLGLLDILSEEPIEGASGYLLEEMVVGGVAEVLVGLRRDPVYGATLTLGLGGVTAELLADTVTRVLPLEADEVRDALRELRLWPLLSGYRGKPNADVSAVVEAVLALQETMLHDENLTEIEINPLILRENGAVAVDALVRRKSDE